MSGSIIIQLNASHIKELAALERACFRTPWQEEDFARALVFPHFTALGIMDEHGLASYLSLNHIPGEMEVLNIATREDVRRTGLARALLAEAQNRMAALRAERIFLEVREHNAPAQKLYASMGFALCGRRRAYYPDTGEDALVMMRALHFQA